MKPLIRALLCLVLLACAHASGAVIDAAEWMEIDKKVAHDPHGMIAASRKALDEARAKGDKKAEAKALLIISKARAGLTETVGASAEDAQGEALAREIGDMWMLAWYLDGKAWVSWHAGRYEEAKAQWKEALDITEKHGLEVIGAWINSGKSHLLMQEGRRAEAMQLMSDAYAIFERRGDKFGMAVMLAHIGVNHGGPLASPEDQAKAADYIHRAFELIDAEVYRTFAVTLNLHLGLTYYRRNDLVTAKRQLEQGLALAHALPYPFMAANIEYHLANLYKDERRFDKALVLMDRALAGMLKHSDKYFISGAHLSRAEIFAEQGRKEESMEALAAALELLPQLDTPASQAHFYPRATLLYERLGEFELAYRQVQALREADKRMADAVNAKLGDELRVRFEVQLKDADNATLRAQQDAAENQRLAAFLTAALAIAAAGGVTFYLRKRAAAARVEARHHKALAEAESKANQAKSTFLANMSHELRTPLNAMLGFSRLLTRSPELPAMARDDLGIIVRSGEHLYTLINEVLDLSRIEAGHVVLQQKNFDLYTLLDELEDTFSLIATQKGVRFEINNSPDLPRHVSADAVKLRQVLANLVGNAFKFTERGSVTLKTDVAGKDGKAYRLSFAVSDTGAGVAPEELDKLGQAFVQAQAGREAHEGTGLGLAISRGFVRLMGGEMGIASEPGRGTTVSFEIAAQEAETVQAGTTTGRRVLALAPGQPVYRILAVDDAPESRQLLVRLLAPLGFEVREAGNGEQAIELCAAWQPHLICMDMRMPVMDGKEATRRIRDREQGSEPDRRTVIIALTASSFEEEREHLMSFGCDDFVRKPFREEELLELIRRHLDVQFLYEDTPSMDAPALPSSGDLASLPADLKARLRGALALLDVEAVDAAIEEIRLHDAGQARALALLAERFEYDRIQDLLGKAEAADVPLAA